MSDMGSRWPISIGDISNPQCAVDLYIAAVDEVVFDLPVNRLSDLVKSEYGYHIFLVEEKRKATRLKKQDVADEIRALLESQKKEEVYLDWLQEMRARAVISVDWAQLEENQNNK